MENRQAELIPAAGIAAAGGDQVFDGPGWPFDLRRDPSEAAVIEPKGPARSGCPCAVCREREHGTLTLINGEWVASEKVEIAPRKKRRTSEEVALLKRERKHLAQVNRDHSAAIRENRERILRMKREGRARYQAMIKHRKPKADSQEVSQ